MNKFHEIEIGKLYDSILAVETVRSQIGIFFATINLGALSIAVTQQKTIIFIFAAFLLLIMIPIDLRARKTLINSYYRLAYLHRRHTKSDIDYSPNRSSRLARDVLRILDLPENSDREAELRSAPWRLKSSMGFWLPIIMGVLEIFAGVILWQLIGWKLV